MGVAQRQSMECLRLASPLVRFTLALCLLLVVQVSQAAAGSVRLFWDRNTESNLAGYVLTYGATPGVYTESVTLPATAQTHEFTDLSDGTYYFAIRAFDMAGMRSGYSNEVRIVVGSTLSISTVAPVSGPAQGGTDVTITGTGFRPGASVLFGGSVGTVLQSSATTLIVRTPAGLPGLTSVGVVNPDGSSATRHSAFNYVGAPPTVTSFSPALGSVTGGTEVAINGSGFQSGIVVKFGTAPATVASVTGTRLVVRTPAQAMGTVALSVVNPDGYGVQVPSAFTYRGLAPVVTNVSPASGPAAGGGTVVIQGSNFQAGLGVSVDAVPATVLSVSPTAIAVRMPAHAPGAVGFIVTNPDSQSYSVANAYTYNEGGPAITQVLPDRGSLDGGNNVTLVGSGFVAGTTVSFGGVPAAVVSQASGVLTVQAPAHAAGAVDVVARTPTGLTAMVSGGYTYEDPEGTFVRYFAEGASGAFFQTRFALANPHDTPVPVKVTFTDTLGAPTVMELVVAANSRATIDETNRPVLASEAFATMFEAPRTLGVERTMSWAAGGPAYGAHSDTGVAAPRTSWVLAEGATIAGFNTFYLLQNPTTTPAQVRVQYLLSTGQRIERIHPVAALSRTNIWVNKEDPALASAEMSATLTSLNGVPLVVERSMYRNTGNELFSTGHNSAAVAAPALRWFLAEGATGGTFDEFVLIANPNSTKARLRVSYLRAGRSPLVKEYDADAQSRLTLWVDQEFAELANAEVSIVVESLTPTPVVVERSMWWAATPGGEWIEAHNSSGTTDTAPRWIVADGEAGGAAGASTYVLVANTGSTAATVRFTLLTESGVTRTLQDVISANGRYSLDVAGSFPDARHSRFSVLVESVSGVAPLVVERASYASTPTTPWAVGTNSLAMPLP